jgi:D-beta-D-heptose 7-phosphate kinase/D-beta-D-heptose 1-phosphate adenosyltransferase
MDEKDIDFSFFRILVIGEAMIDEYIYGDSSRISPEAPVPVVKFQKSSRSLGGSANVAWNFASLGAKVDILTFVGNDENKDKLFSIAKKEKVGVIPVITSHPTIVKNRIISRNQQVLRIDYEDDSDVTGEDEKKIMGEIRKIVPSLYHAIILSDYNKGFFTKLIVDTIFDHFKGGFILADVKPKKMALFAKASMIKSNFSEYKEFLKQKNIIVSNTDEDIEKNRNIILTNFKSYLLTRSEKGLSYISKERIENIPTNAKSVFDVTGAGDTVTAAFVLEYLKTKNIELSMNFANISAGIVLSKYGCVPITKQDLLFEEKKENSKIISDYKDLKILSQRLKSQGKKIVFTNGCYDLLHSGHALFLKKAKELGDVLIVGLNDDASVRKYKGKGRPIIDEKSRLTLMSSLESIDYVVLFHEDDPRAVLDIVKPNVHVKGGDYNDKIIESDIVKKNGGRLEFLNLETADDGSKISTSGIIEKVVKVYGNKKEIK